MRHVAFDRRELRFGQRERNVHRRDLVDGDDRRRVVGANEIARVHLEQTRAAVERRGDCRVIELHAGVLN